MSIFTYAIDCEVWKHLSCNLCVIVSICQFKVLIVFFFLKESFKKRWIQK